MSVEMVKPGVWRVRWREGNRNRSKVLGRKRDAEAFDAEVRRRRRLGELAMMDRGADSLDEFVQEWYAKYAVPNLEPKTIDVYEWALNKHILPELGALPLREVSTDEISAWKARMASSGVGAEAQRKALRLLRGILQRAVEWKRLPRNEARLVRLPMPPDSPAVRPLPPETVEAIRGHFLGRGRHRDAVLTSVLAYAGLRPQEAHALCWHHLQERTLMIEQRVTNGIIRRSTKNRQNRTVRLLGPVAQDLREFRFSCGRPDDGKLIFAARDGGPWNQWALDHWRGRAFKAAKEAVGIEDATPYTLRHSFASLLIWEGRPITYVAAQLGHSPAMTLRTYAHVFEELEDADRTTAEAAIQRARGKLVPPQYLSESSVV